MYLTTADVVDHLKWSKAPTRNASDSAQAGKQAIEKLDSLGGFFMRASLALFSLISFLIRQQRSNTLTVDKFAGSGTMRWQWSNTMTMVKCSIQHDVSGQIRRQRQTHARHLLQRDCTAAAPLHCSSTDRIALVIASVRGALTDGGDDEDDEEGVGHRQHRVGQRREDLGDGGQLAEDAQHAAAAQQQDQADGQADGGEAHDGEGDNDDVEEVPAVADEVAEPVGEGVDDELDAERDDEEEVQLVQGREGRGLRAGVEVHLRLGDAHGEVLRGGGQAAGQPLRVFSCSVSGGERPRTVIISREEKT